MRKSASWKAMIGAFAVAGLLAGTFGLSAEAEAAKKRNESRWFLQNVCMANATKILGRSDWKKFAQEAKASRSRLRNRGVPEAHLREMEGFATNIIQTTTTKDNAHEGPQLCIQWYKT